MNIEIDELKIGNRKVLASISNLMIPADEDAAFNVREGASLIATFRIRFNDEATETSLAFETKDSEALLTFNKWNDMVRALAVPLRVGTDSNGNNLSILVSNVRVGRMNILSMLFMIDEVHP